MDKMPLPEGLASLLAAPASGPDAWGQLVGSIDEAPPHALDDVVGEVDRHLQSQLGGHSYWLESDQRVAPSHWVHPEPSPALLLARELLIETQSMPEPIRGGRNLTGSSTVELWKLGVDDAAAWILDLARSRHTHAIERLHIGDMRLRADGLAELLSTPLAESIAMLELPGCDIGGTEGARVIASWPGAAHLQLLNLSFCRIEADGLAALLDAEMPGLWRIELGTNCVHGSGELSPADYEAYWCEVFARCQARNLEILLT